MKTRQYAYLGGAVLAAAVVAISGWYPITNAQNASQPVFAAEPYWPKPLPAPVGTDGIAHPWVQGEVAGNCIDPHDNVYTFNRGWEVGLTVNGVLQGNESGAINSQGIGDAFASIPSPPVVAFDSDGNVIAGWGNPSLIQTGADYGYAAYMPHGALLAHIGTHLPAQLGRGERIGGRPDIHWSATTFAGRADQRVIRR